MDAHLYSSEIESLVNILRVVKDSVSNSAACSKKRMTTIYLIVLEKHDTGRVDVEEYTCLY